MTADTKTPDIYFETKTIGPITGAAFIASAYWIMPETLFKPPVLAPSS